MDNIKDSELWLYAQEEFKRLPLREKVERISKVVYPARKTKLDLEEKLDVILKCPSAVEMISVYLDEREKEILELLDSGLTLSEAAREAGYKSRSSATQIVHSIKAKLERQLMDEEDLEDAIIKLTGAKC